MSGREDILGGELAALRVFAQVVAAGSLSAAARRLNISLAVVSRRLSALEDELGVRLIERSSRKFMLTNEGVLLHERALSIIDATEAAVAEVRAMRGRVEGALRISAPHEIGRRRIAAICSGFSATHPDVSIELSLTDDRSDVLRSGFDVMFRTKRPIEGDVTQRKVVTSRRVICAAPAYLRASGGVAAPDDLKHHRCIVLRRGPVLYDRWTVKGSGGGAEIRVPATLTADSTDVIHDWALEGAGIAVKAFWDIEDDLRTGKLVEVLAEYCIDKLTLYAAFAGHRHIPLRLRKFIDYLVEEISRPARAGGADPRPM